MIFSLVAIYFFSRRNFNRNYPLWESLNCLYQPRDMTYGKLPLMFLWCSWCKSRMSPKKSPSRGDVTWKTSPNSEWDSDSIGKVSDNSAGVSWLTNASKLSCLGKGFTTSPAWKLQPFRDTCPYSLLSFIQIYNTSGIILLANWFVTILVYSAMILQAIIHFIPITAWTFLSA